jgi:hypothetical protein
MKERLDLVWVPTLFLLATLDFQIFLFVFNMTNIVKLTIQKPFHVNFANQVMETIYFLLDSWKKNPKIHQVG